MTLEWVSTGVIYIIMCWIKERWLRKKMNIVEIILYLQACQIWIKIDYLPAIQELELTINS